MLRWYINLVMMSQLKLFKRKVVINCWELALNERNSEWKVQICGERD